MRIRITLVAVVPLEQAIVKAEARAFIANPDELYEPHTPVDLARRLAP
jgi:hypothetical protein